MTESVKDVEQDRIIRENSVRIARNEEAIKRQTEALEQIRDHYYPPPVKWWKKTAGFCGKVVCVIVAYLGIAEAVDWIWNTHESQSLAKKYANVAWQLFSTEGDFAGAMSCYEKAIKLDPRESEYAISLTFMKGMALSASFMDNDRIPTDAEQAKIDAALADAIMLDRLEPQKPMPKVLMAQAYLLSGENDEAVAAVNRAVACAPAWANVHVSACAIQFATGHPEEARKQILEAERLDPSLPLMHSWKGMLSLIVDHDVAAAKKEFEETIRIVPRFGLAHQWLGMAMLAEAKPDLAAVRAKFKRALVLNAKLTRSMYGIAQTYEREGDDAMAMLWLERALTVNPNFLLALEMRARMAQADGDAATAVADLTTAIGLVPFRADLYRMRSAAYAKLGEEAKARKDGRTADALEKTTAGASM